MSRLKGKVRRLQLNLYFTVEKEDHMKRKLTQTKIKGRSPRIYVYRDQLVIRQTRPEDSGVYTCFYRNRPRIEWAVTVSNPGVEPYRQISWPYVALDVDGKEKNKTDRIPENVDHPRLLRPKTYLRGNIQVR